MAKVHQTCHLQDTKARRTARSALNPPPPACRGAGVLDPLSAKSVLILKPPPSPSGPAQSAGPPPSPAGFRLFFSSKFCSLFDAPKMQSKSPKMAPSVRKWCPRAPKIEPKTTPGPLFSGFGDPLFSCNTTVVLLYFMGSRVPGTAQNEKKTRSLNSALQKVRKKRKKCAFSGQRCRK